MFEVEGYRSERKSSRLYGGKDRYTWVQVTDPEGEHHYTFDPWLGPRLPQHYLLECLARIARQQGERELARRCLERAYKQARQSQDKTHDEHLLSLVDTPADPFPPDFLSYAERLRILQECPESTRAEVIELLTNAVAAIPGATDAIRAWLAEAEEDTRMQDLIENPDFDTSLKHQERAA